jgi:hypothetical protein
MLGSLPPIKSRLARPSPVQPGLQMLAREPRNQRWGPEPSSQAASRFRPARARKPSARHASYLAVLFDCCGRLTPS